MVGDEDFMIKDAGDYTTLTNSVHETVLCAKPNLIFRMEVSVTV